MNKKSMVDELNLRGHARNIMDDMAKELGFAVNDLRHELVEKPWFKEKVTPDIDPFDVNKGDLDPTAAEGLEAKDFSQSERDDLYGKDQARDVDRDDLYGKDIDRDDGMEREIDRDIDR